MKQLVYYSSQTGNTKQVAETIYDELSGVKDNMSEDLQVDP